MNKYKRYLREVYEGEHDPSWHDPVRIRDYFSFLKVQIAFLIASIIFLPGEIASSHPRLLWRIVLIAGPLLLITTFFFLFSLHHQQAFLTLIIVSALVTVVLVIGGSHERRQKQEELRKPLPWYVHATTSVALGCGLITVLLIMTFLTTNLDQVVASSSSQSLDVPRWFAWFVQLMLTVITLCFLVACFFSLYWSERVQVHIRKWKWR